MNERKEGHTFAAIYLSPPVPNPSHLLGQNFFKPTRSSIIICFSDNLISTLPPYFVHGLDNTKNKKQIFYFQNYYVYINR